jgi:hypothetical protein
MDFFLELGMRNAESDIRLSCVIHILQEYQYILSKVSVL